MKEGVRRLAELGGLWSLAVAAPALGPLGDSPTYFVALRATPGEIVALALGVTLAPPLLLALVAAGLSRARPAAAARLHLTLLGALAAAIVAGALHRLGPGAAGVALTAIAGGAFGWGCGRSATVRSLALFTAPAAAAIPAAFLLSAPLRPVLAPHGAAGFAAEARRPAPIVFVVFDELPLASLLDAPGHLDAHRFPSFARLARTATWYPRAVTPGSYTDLAVPALLSGRPARGATVPPIAPAYPVNLFSILPADWPILALENVTKLCPATRCGEQYAQAAGGERLGVMLADAAAIWLRAVVPPAWAAGLPTLEGRWGDYWRLLAAPPGQATLLDAIRFPEVTFHRFLDALGGPDRPSLAFLHLNLPHEPLQYLPDGRRYAPDREMLPKRWSDPPEALLSEQRHLLATGYADRLLGELLDRLEATGLAGRALLVVTSDHGVAFRPGRPTRVADADTLGEIAPVPLFIRFPGQVEGRRDDRDADLVDVLPILADALGLPPPPGATGELVPPGGRRHQLLEDADARATFTGEEAAASLSRAVVRQRERFGAGDWEAVFAAGPRPDLFGRTLSAAPRPLATARIDELGALARVDPAAPFVPTLLSGELDRAVSGAVAVSLNGRVAAVVEPAGRRFRALVPWAWLRPGQNTIALQLVTPGAGGPVLGGVALAGALTLDGDVLRVEGGASTRLGERPRVLLERRAATARGLYLEGAVEAGAASDPSEILVFAGARLIARSGPGVAPRPDLAQRGWADPAIFSLDVDLAGAGDGPIRVIARSARGASEAPAPAGAGPVTATPRPATGR